MVTIVLKSYAAPGNTDEYKNVKQVGATTCNSGNQVTDQASAVTGLGSSAFVPIVYTDDSSTVRNLTIAAGDIKTIL